MLQLARIGVVTCGVLLVGMAILVLILAIIAKGPITSDPSLDLALFLGATFVFGVGLFFIRVGIIAGQIIAEQQDNTVQNPE